MQEKINQFVEPIFIKKKTHDFHAWIKKRKLLKIIKNTSPDFDMMMDIYKFLSILHKVYMYPSDKHLQLVQTMPKDCNGAFLYEGDKFTLKFFLRNADRNIYIRIERYPRSKNEDTEISFQDGTYTIQNKYEEETFIFIIACMMEGVTELIEYYYKNKKF